MRHEQKVAEVRAAYEAARDSFRAYLAASKKMNQVKKPESVEAARTAYGKALRHMEVTKAHRDYVTNLYGIEVTKVAVDQARAAEGDTL